MLPWYSQEIGNKESRESWGVKYEIQNRKADRTGNMLREGVVGVR